MSKKLIIGFSTSNKPLARLIRFITKSTVSHTYIRIPVPEYNENMVFQASNFTVNYCNYSVFKSHTKVVEEYEADIDDATWQQSELFRITESGKPYSFVALLGFVWVLGLRQIGLKVKNPFRDGNISYVCVEVVARCLGLGGVSEDLTPEDLRRYCAKNSKLIYKSTEN